MAEMNDDVKKYLQEKYQEQLNKINVGQAFSNLGDVFAQQKVGTANPFFSEQRKLAYGGTLGEYENQQDRAAQLAQQEAMLAMRKQALDQGAAGRASDRELRRALAGQQMAQKTAKEQELSLSEAKQRGLYEIGQKAEEQYSKAIEKGKTSGEFDPTSYSDILDASSLTPNFLKSGSAIEADAAKSAWVEAFLRDASGAAIPPDERLDYAKPFFEQPGDTPQVVANKAEMRKQKMQNALMGSGVQPSQLRMGMGQEAQPETKIRGGEKYIKVQGGWQKVGP